jgi:acetyltransferase-like isoleucine patch superfamily enzyme
MYGDRALGYVVKAELIAAMASSAHGAWGLFLRSKLYPSLFRGAGTGVLFGRNITLRHAHKVTIGNNVIIDDNCVIDAKGEGNDGVFIGDNVYIGRNTIVYCKGGDIRIGNRVNISSNCTVFSSNKLSIADDTIVGAYSYLLSGGAYDYADTEKRFSEQSGMLTKGELKIGANCWLGARVTVLDGASIGDHCVIGAGAVVTKPVPAESLAAGVPAKVIKSLPVMKNRSTL